MGVLRNESKFAKIGCMDSVTNLGICIFLTHFGAGIIITTIRGILLLSNLRK